MVKVLVNVSTKKYSLRMRWALRKMGIRWYHFPLEEIPDMGVKNLLRAVAALEEADKAGDKVILHCMFGNNRSRAGNLPDEKTMTNLLLSDLHR